MKEKVNSLPTMELDELAAFKSNGFPFISLYLNTQPDRHGRDDFDRFIRKQFSDRARTFSSDSPERESFERDAGRIALYLRNQLKPSANGLAVFACAGANNYFKAIEFEAPIQTNELHVAPRPHLYPLARLIDQNPRYVALIADTNEARLFVFDLGKTKTIEMVNNSKTSLAQVGERTQLHYRRRLENDRLHHVKEIVEMLERVVRKEEAHHIVLAGDEVIIPLLREKLSAQLSDKVIDILRLDIRSPEHIVLKATLEALHEDNRQTDAEKVRDLIDKFRSGGLAILGWRDTLDALSNGQVDELIISASPESIQVEAEQSEELFQLIAAAGNSHAASLAATAGPTSPAAIADLLVTSARKTGAAITFIEDTILLGDVGGVGATLRYRI